jgi:hypothetical protein
LFEQFLAQAIPVRWLHEEDMVEAFERFAPELAVDELRPDLFLKASAALTEWCRRENSVFILDSHLPGFYYLYGRNSEPELAAYNTELLSILSSLNPLIIYLRSDVETALMRGVRQRGAQWLENISAYLRAWSLPFYGGELKPLRTKSDVIEFFTRVDRFALKLLGEWPDSLILETDQLAIQQLMAETLRYLNIEAHDIDIDKATVSTDLSRYPGVYIAYEEASQPLTVRFVDGELFVDSYWPTGARLLAEGDSRFYLEGTNRYINFTLSEDGQASGLIYSYATTSLRYRKKD